MLSTRNLAALPNIHELRALMQSLALLDAIVCPEWELRRCSFNAHWDQDEAMGSMRDGEGDDLFALFTSDAAILKGFAHEAPMSPYALDPPRVWPGVLDKLPARFAGFLAEPAFKLADTTFCLWRTDQELAWQHGPVALPAGADPDGSAALLELLDGQPRTYQRWAEDYYEQPVPLRSVAHIYRHRPLTAAIVRSLNPDLALADLEPDRVEIGYP